MRRRIDLIDSTRGFCLICMVIYHCLFNVVYIFNILDYLLYNPIMNFLQICFASLFIVISGIASNFSKDNISRGLKIFSVAILVTILTYVINNTNYVQFGILHFLGVSLFFFGLIKKHFDTLPLTKFFLVTMFILFLTTLNLSSIDFEYNFFWVLGMTSNNFVSLDYFPIFPWIFMFFIGAYLGKYITRGMFPSWFYTVKCAPLSYIGKKSLLIYVLHQPILALIIFLVVQMKGQ